jgi:hypothetical protein
MKPSEFRRYQEIQYRYYRKENQKLDRVKQHKTRNQLVEDEMNRSNQLSVFRIKIAELSDQFVQIGPIPVNTKAFFCTFFRMELAGKNIIL